MSTNLVCKMPNCGGTLGSNTFPLQTGCYSTSPCRSCETCGRVHSHDGYLMYNRPGASLYLVNNRLEHVLMPVNFELGAKYKNIGYLFVCQDQGEETPEMVDVEPNTELIFDGITSDNMFRFHTNPGIKYLLHRGDVNFIEKVS